MKTERKLTKWISDSKPTLPGVYKRKNIIVDRGVNHIVVSYSYWSGKIWYIGCTTIEGAAEMYGHVSNFQSLPWCGLAQDPNK
jgi:hypothetical protein